MEKKKKKWSQVKGLRSVDLEGRFGGYKINLKCWFMANLFSKVTLEQQLKGGKGVGLSDICWKTLKVKQIALR